MFGEVFERFIQNRHVAVMVRVLLENFLNADKLDCWFDTVRKAQYTKDIQQFPLSLFRAFFNWFFEGSCGVERRDVSFKCIEFSLANL